MQTLCVLSNISRSLCLFSWFPGYFQTSQLAPQMFLSSTDLLTKSQVYLFIGPVLKQSVQDGRFYPDTLLGKPEILVRTEQEQSGY